MNERIRALLQQKGRAVDSARAILDAADADNHRALTDAENSEFVRYETEIADINKRIEREHALAEQERTAPSYDIGSVNPVGGRPRVLDDPKRGFSSLGEFAMSVAAAGQPGARMIDERLSIVAAAPTTYGNESSGQDGGFLVPPEFGREVFRHSLEGDALLPLTDNIPVTGNTMSFPRDETTPWGSDGIRAYWENEAALATQTKPKGDRYDFRLSKLFALVPVTDELMADAASLDSYIGGKMAESIRWKSNLSIFQGSGVGQPKGFFGHASQVSVAKETSQTADTVVAENVAKMFARQLRPDRAVWLINNDVYPQLLLLNKANQMLWTPDFRLGPGGALFGRPVIMTQLCKTVGDQGDIVFADLGYYRTITKSGGIETATSMHLYFDAGATAFRATFRIDGQPSISAAVSPANGSNTLSPFVVLDARA